MEITIQVPVCLAGLFAVLSGEGEGDHLEQHLVDLLLSDLVSNIVSDHLDASQFPGEGPRYFATLQSEPFLTMVRDAFHLYNDRYGVDSRCPF